MPVPIFAIRRLLCAALTLCVVVIFGRAADSGENVAADQVLDRWVKVVGGVKTLKAIKWSEYKMQMAAVYNGATDGKLMEMQHTVLADGPFHTVFLLPNGEMEAGDDGRSSWLYHPGLGGQVWEPRRAERIRRDSSPTEPLRVKENFPVRRLLPDIEFGGKKAHVIELTDRYGWRERWHFDLLTGFRIRRERPDELDGPTSIDYSDFRKVNGIVEPFRYGMLWANGIGQVIEVQTVVHSRAARLAAWQMPPNLESETKRVNAALQMVERSAGNREAALKIKSRVTKALVSNLTNGISYEVTTKIKAPNRVLVEQDIPGVGRMMRGYDGKTGWAWSEIEGYRVLTGPELAQLASMANLVPPRLGSDTPLRRVVGESSGPDDHRILAVDLATSTGSTGIHHIDLVSGLLVKVETIIQAGPGGLIRVEVKFGDYRDVDGVKLAFAEEVNNPAIHMVTKLLSVDHNIGLADEIFAPRKTGEIFSAPAKIENQPSAASRSAASAPTADRTPAPGPSPAK